MKFLTARMKDNTYTFVGIDQASGGYMHTSDTPSIVYPKTYEFWIKDMSKNSETTAAYDELILNELTIDKRTGVVMTKELENFTRS